MKLKIKPSQPEFRGEKKTEKSIKLRNQKKKITEKTEA
jgi:hypothetical protein